MSISPPCEAGQPRYVAAPFSIEILVPVNARRLRAAFEHATSLGIALALFERRDLTGGRLLQMDVPMSREATKLESAQVTTFLLDRLGFAAVVYQTLSVRGFEASDVLVNVDGHLLDVDQTLAHITAIDLVARPLARA